MKTQLRKGRANTLNVYTVGSASDSLEGLLGYATFSWSYVNNTKNHGVVLIYSSVPGGTYYPYDEGKTLTHEVG